MIYLQIKQKHSNLVTLTPYDLSHSTAAMTQVVKGRASDVQILRRTFGGRVLGRERGRIFDIRGISTLNIQSDIVFTSVYVS